MSTVVDPMQEMQAPPVRPGVALRPARSWRERLIGDRGVWAAWGFLAPALLSLFFFFLLPVLAAFALSFTDFDIYGIGDAGTARFVGWRNYTAIFQDATFWQTFDSS